MMTLIALLTGPFALVALADVLASRRTAGGSTGLHPAVVATRRARARRR